MTDPRPVLMVPAWRYTAGTLLPVAARLKEEGNPVVFVLPDRDDRTVPEIEDAGFTAFPLDLPRPEGRYLTRLALGYRTPRILREKPWRRLADEVLDRHDPRLVVVNNETWFESPLIRRAAVRGIPSLAVQWAFALPQRYFDEQRRDIVRRLGGTPRSFHFSRELDRFEGPPRRSPLHRLARNLLRPVQAANAFLAARWLGIPRHRASWATGPATLKTVIGPAFRDQFAAQGADPERIRVAGLPEHDTLHALATDADRRAALRRETRARFDVGDDRILAVVGARATKEDGYPPEEAYGELAAVIRTLRERPESPRVVVKLHPRQTVSEIEENLGRESDVVYVRDIDKAPLFCAADLFLSSFSSVILWAIALDIPVVTYNCLRIPGGDIFEWIGGTVHARTAADLPPAVEEALTDEATRTRLAAEREAVRRSHMVFDGRCVERIAGIARELMA